MKIPIADDTETDAKKYFDKVAEFINRVEGCKGKVGLCMCWGYG